MYNLSLLSPKTFSLLQESYTQDPHEYIKYLTIFSSFTDYSCLYELDSLLFSVTSNTDHFYFGLRGFNYNIPRYSIYVPYCSRSKGHCTNSLFLSFSMLRFIGISSMELIVHPMNLKAISLYRKLGFYSFQSISTESILLTRNVPASSRIVPFSLSSNAFDTLQHMSTHFTPNT